MYFIKNIVIFFLNIIENYRYKKIISSEDLKITKNQQFQNNKALNQIFENGYVVIDNYFSSKDIDETRESLKFDKIKNNWLYATFAVQPKSLADRILNDEHIKNLLVNYLGKDAKLDSIEANLYTYNPKKKNSSEKWHYDVVGRRIKIFLFLNDCKSIFTEYVNGTNKVLHNNYTSSGSRATDILISNKYNQTTKIYPKKGSLLIFDTNGYHKGVYRGIEKSNGNDQRYTIQMEFSSKSKSDRLFNIKCNSVGVRNVFISKNCDFKNYLLDKDCMNEFANENIIFYDQQYSAS